MKHESEGSAHRETGLAEGFVLLADSLKPDYDVLDTMDVLVHVSTEFTSASEAGIVLADGRGALHVMASTSERTSDVEEAQLGTSEGPCLDCFRSGTMIEIADLSLQRRRWPAFTRIAQERGFAADHAFPLTLRGHTLGVLNLFSTRPGTLSDRDAALAQAMADVATIGVVQHRRLSRQYELTGQLQSALDGRVVIEQAKGVLSQQHGIPIDAAFSVLRKHARENQARLRDIAGRVVDLTLTLPQQWS